jgi:hypothetical protein
MRQRRRVRRGHVLMHTPVLLLLLVSYTEDMIHAYSYREDMLRPYSSIKYGRPACKTLGFSQLILGIGTCGPSGGASNSDIPSMGLARMAYMHAPLDEMYDMIDGYNCRMYDMIDGCML